jgi:uncharacterized protein YodC (DUF2158 family)
MMQEQFTPGDVVELKSGGPRMTYEGERAMTGEALCVWFDGMKRVSACFDHSSLKKVEATGA